MNLGDPELAEKYAELPVDGIGLMREEFLWTTYIHDHPLYLIETGHPEKGRWFYDFLILSRENTVI